MRLILLIAAAASLAACNKPAATPAATASASPGGEAAPAAGAPHRRAGLWQTSVTVDGHSSPMATMKLCVDAAMEAKSTAFHPTTPMGLGKSNPCAYPPPTRNLDGSFSFSGTCPVSGGGQISTKGSASGDWSSAYHVHIETDSTGVAVASGHHVTDMDGKWLGPCPEGMAGGDMELANGMKFSGGKVAGAAAMLHGLTGGGASGAQ
jgi:hypothetical protein